MNLTQLRADMVVLCLLATTALSVGLLINQFRDTPLPLVHKNQAERLQDAVKRIATQPAAPSAEPVTRLPKQLSIEEFSAYVQNKRGLIIDARPEIFHRLGHVPGALSLARDDFENRYTALKDKLESDRSQPIVIYCSGPPCESSQLVKKALTSLGFTNIALFEGGWDAWSGAKRPEETGQ